MGHVKNNCLYDAPFKLRNTNVRRINRKVKMKVNLDQVEERKQLIKKIHSLMVGECNKYDDPIRFLELSLWKQNKLINWISGKLEPGKSINNGCSSYRLKHYFSNDVGGFYVKNGAFKGAMLMSGFKIDDKKAQNWNFNIKQKSVTRLNKEFTNNLKEQ